MNTSSRYLILSACVFGILTGCAENTQPAKTESFSEKEETSLKLAHGTEISGDISGAEKIYRQIARQNSTEGSLELAEFYIRQHQIEKASTTLTDALHSNPKNPLLSRALANLYIHRHMPDKALVLLNDTLKANPDESLLYNSKGVALDMLGRYHDAQQCYHTALELAPNDALTFKANLGMSYIISGHPKQAITLLEPELKNPEVTPTIRQNLALAYGLTGQKEKAKALSMKDMSESETQDNLNFYHLISHEHTSGTQEKIEPVRSPAIP